MNVSGSIFHIHLFLSFAFELLESLALFVHLIVFLLDFLLDETLHFGDLLTIALTTLLDIFDLALQNIETLVFGAILLICLLLQHFGFELDELADAFRDKILGIELLLQEFDALIQVLLFLVVDTLDTRDLSVGLTFAVLHVQILLGLGFVDLLLKGKNLLVVLIGLFGILILSDLELVI